jgi:UDP-2-acetamido-2,6-beta-L-arabino-hexul-4-ose reductase
MTATKVVVTGAGGFIGKNLCVRMGELAALEVRPIGSTASSQELGAALADADVAVHLAGVNRPQDPAEHMSGNHGSVLNLVAAIQETGRKVPVILTSSTRAEDDSAYGRSKKAAETTLIEFANRIANPATILRLANVFGKWCRPNYNSVVATFCHNIARDIPITVHDAAAPLSLVYIDDVVAAIVDVVLTRPDYTGYREVSPVFKTSVGEVAKLIQGFRSDRREGLIDSVGAGMIRALYATYVSYLPPAEFCYPLVAHADPRGLFAEVLKTRSSGQFSYFTAIPGVTRGGHYHHSKTEKFLIVSGQALFRFRNILTGEMHELRTSGRSPVIVETIPGWAHDVTNVGEDTLVSLLWANEVFDHERPDTVAQTV